MLRIYDYNMESDTRSLENRNVVQAVINPKSHISTGPYLLYTNSGSGGTNGRMLVFI